MNIGIILAGGIGTRMGQIERPKQFIEIYGKPIVVHTIEAFEMHKDIDQIAVVCLKEWMESLRGLIRRYELSKVQWIIEAGETRQDSTNNALNHLRNVCNDDDILIIHDAARPLISSRIITENIIETKKSGAVDTVISATDTIVCSLDGKRINDIPKRKNFFLGQTPQSFKYSVITNAYDTITDEKRREATDDCKIVKAYGHEISLVMGDKINFKITTSDDLMMLKAMLKLSDMGRGSYVFQND
ncbi:IspD/TarI family cytidylyltransferase [Aminipila sp.]|uniref:IspD/TarI family cytidylyltransferase n=1 Tax=Aminipila sp. TaxID=2060095 RepID=UPI00289BF102|nr:IspD/TarI family cytidylyltransferase [Aminipila sp.]